MSGLGLIGEGDIKPCLGFIITESDCFLHKYNCSTSTRKICKCDVKPWGNSDVRSSYCCCYRGWSSGSCWDGRNRRRALAHWKSYRAPKNYCKGFHPTSTNRQGSS